MNSNKLIHILGYAGLIPFYFLSIISNFKNYNFAIDIFFIYSVIILCFLSGSLWMKLILLPAKTNNQLLKILSVGFPLIALASELMVTYILKVIIYILIYLLIYISDKKTAGEELPVYLRMRFFLTGNVIFAHIIVLYAISTNGLF